MKPLAKFHQNPSLSNKISNFPFVCGPQSVWLPNIWKNAFFGNGLGNCPTASTGFGSTSSLDPELLTLDA